MLFQAHSSLNKQEVWNPISGFSRYEVSNFGNVKSYKYTVPKILKPGENPAGRLQVCLSKNGKTKNYSVLIPNPENKPEINHKDGNPKNNHVSNLEWCTRSENMKHAFSNGLNISENCRKAVSLAKRGEGNHNSKLTEEDVKKIRGLLKNTDLSQTEIAGRYKIDQSIVSRIKTKSYWRHVV